MKKNIIDILKKYKFKIIIICVFVFLNIYFLTYPPKLIGKIVDLLSDTKNNRVLIIKNVFYLVESTILLLVLRMPWRYLAGYVARSFERDLKNKIFDHFMKIKMTSIQNIKNGELMAYITKDVGEIRVFV